ncbi:MAG: hypothetical protein EXR70_09085 [Deltaproteobacteria bacterium]|nr:hypothetical protein [Deltaproteobacteria bacterium]
MTKAEAQAIAQKEIERLIQGLNVEWLFLDEFTKEEDFGWVFFYESRRFVETQEVSDRLLGNSPIVVDRWGRLHHVGTAGPASVLIEQLKLQGAFDPPADGGKS